MAKSISIPSISSILKILPVAFVVWMLEIFLVVSLAALLFTGDLSIFAVEGTGLLLFGGLVFVLVIALTSSFVTAISAPQEVPIVIASLMTAKIATEMKTAAPEALLATVVIAIIFSTLLTGVAFWLIGHFRLGQLVRFIPYPVIGSFMVGTGWALFIGGIGIMTTVPLGTALLAPEVLLRWLPGLALGMTLLLVTQRSSHFLLLPSLLLGSIALFYLTYFLATGSLTTAGAEGWLLGPFPTGSLWQPVTALAFDQVNWWLVLGDPASLAAIVLMSAIALLLNISGLEVSTRTDADLNWELKSIGAANLLAGLGGSAVGFPSMSLSLVGHRLGVHTRLTGVITAVLVALTLFLGAGILSLIPRLIAGGLLIFLALSFFGDWLYQGWFRLSRTDYLLIWFILLAIIFVGFLEGVGVGIVVAVILFVLDYSRIDAVRYALTGAERRSSVVRPLLTEQLLQHRGQHIFILVLHGFLFFGSAHRIIERVRTRLDQPDLPTTRFILLDFRLVTGIDASALFAFSRLLQLAQSQQVTVVVTHLANTIRPIWEREFRQEGSELTHIVFPNLDQGLAWCEEEIIAAFTSVGLSAKPKSFVQQVEAILRQDEEPIDWLAHLRPDMPPAELPQITLLKEHLAPMAVAAGEPIVRQGEPAAGIYVLENGRAVVKSDANDVISTLEKQAIIGGEELFTRRPFASTILAEQPTTLLFLSRASLKQLESEAPAVAIAIHHVLTTILSNELGRTRHLVTALQR